MIDSGERVALPGELRTPDTGGDLDLDERPVAPIHADQQVDAVTSGGPPLTVHRDVLVAAFESE